MCNKCNCSDHDEHTERRLTLEKPYGVIVQAVQFWKYAAKDSRLTTNIKTFATYNEALDHAKMQGVKFPGYAYFIVSALDRIIYEKPQPAQHTMNWTQIMKAQDRAEICRRKHENQSQ